ncbi:MAG: hypothetical protein KKB82_00410 [Candidatus Omnitrophica bacterium]|nr:hypothetical protein [Candidatus Omnitrophota bacterium]MBU1924364.1 hypothetical protein [Candidatus Omnitrophota bacterium]
MLKGKQYNKCFKILASILIQIFITTSFISNSYSFISPGAVLADKDSGQYTLSPHLGIANPMVMEAFQSIGQVAPQEKERFLLPQSKTWLQTNQLELFRYFEQNPLITASAEGYDEDLSEDAGQENFKGGLGGFFGDFLAGNRIIGLKTVAFQPLHSKRRRQRIKVDYDEVVNGVEGALRQIKERNFSTYAFEITTIIADLAQRDKLSLPEFTAAVETSNAEYAKKHCLEYEKLENMKKDITGENIAFIYTAAVSALIKEAVNKKEEQSKRAIRRVLEAQLKKEVGDDVIENLFHKVKPLAEGKRYTFEHFQNDHLSKDQKIQQFLSDNSVNYQKIYDDLANFLALLPITRVQHIDEEVVSHEGRPGAYILNQDGTPFTVTVKGLDVYNPYQDKEYEVRFKYIIKGTQVKISFECPDLLTLLYQRDTDDIGKRHRFNNCVIPAKAMYVLMKQFEEFTPGMFHLNESPYVVAAALMEYDERLSQVPRVYTNHTVVPAGLSRFDAGSMGVSPERLFQVMFGYGYKIGTEEYPLLEDANARQRLNKDMGRLFIKDGKVDFSWAALQLSDETNAVSDEHAKVTKDKLFMTEKEIKAVLNGSGDFFVHERLLAKELEKGRENIDGNDLWDIYANPDDGGKKQFIDEIYERTGIRLDSNKLIISLIRRLAEYKSQYDILKDIVRVVCADRGKIVQTKWGDMAGLGEQVVVGGFATRFGKEEKFWIKEFLSWMVDPDLRGRFVFVPDFDTKLLKLQAMGALCVNCPRPEEEACGTSNMKGSRHGQPNIVVHNSGGGKEHHVPLNRQARTGSSTLVGPYRTDDDFSEFYEKAPKDILDALAAYGDIYYTDKDLWKTIMLNEYRSSEKVTAEAMSKRYVEKVFISAREKAKARLLKKSMRIQKPLDLITFFKGTNVNNERLIGQSI